jgi:hypothetical protein
MNILRERQRRQMFAFRAALIAFLAPACILIAQDVPSAQDSVPPVYHAGENGVKGPVPIAAVEAKAPYQAIKNQFSGKCAISIDVDTLGKPQNVQVIHCTNPIFAPPSLSAAAQYRFKPATTKEGKPVPVRIPVEVEFRMFGGSVPKVLVSYAMHTPPGAASSVPDIKGVYPLIGSVVPPKLIQFSDDGYGNAVLVNPGNSPCDMLLTIDAKGKAGVPDEVHCENPYIERAVARSLLNSRYQPGSFNGDPVPVRAAVHLEFAGFATNQ